MFSRRKAIIRQLSRSAIRDCAICRIRRLVAEQQPGDDHRDDARRVDLLGGDERRRTARRARSRRRGPGRSRSSAGPWRPRGRARSPTSTPPPAAMHEVEADVEGVEAGARRDRERGAQRDQRGRVVQQRLALEDRGDPARQPDPAADRRGRDRVGRRDDRADREGERPSEVGQEQLDDDGDTDGRERRRDRPTAAGSAAGWPGSRRARCSAPRRRAAAAGARTARPRTRGGSPGPAGCRRPERRRPRAAAAPGRRSGPRPRSTRAPRRPCRPGAG